MVEGKSYPTEIGFLSLVDTCIHRIIHHSEINTSGLPKELHEHIENRKRDEYYRVSPEYSHEKFKTFTDIIEKFVVRMTTIHGETKRLDAFIELFKSINDFRNDLQYYPRLNGTMKSKLLEVAKHGVRIDIAKRYLWKWYGYKLITPPPRARPAQPTRDILFEVDITENNGVYVNDETYN